MKTKKTIVYKKRSNIRFSEKKIHFDKQSKPIYSILFLSFYSKVLKITNVILIKWWLNFFCEIRVQNKKLKNKVEQKSLSWVTFREKKCTNKKLLNLSNLKKIVYGGVMGRGRDFAIWYI